jgi:signal transduction histidine kinase
MRRYVGLGRIVLITMLVTLAIPDADPIARPLVAAVAVLTYVCVLFELAGARALLRSVLSTTVTVIAVGLVLACASASSSEGWAFATAAVTVICAQYEFAARPGLAWTVSAVAATSYTCGAIAGATDPSPARTGLRMLIEAALSFASVLLLRKWARAADRSQRRVAGYRRAEQLARARRAEEQEYLATLHDTASTTLFMVSIGDGGHEWIPDRAAQDLLRLSAPYPGDGPDVDLVALLRTASEHPDVDVRLRLPDALTVPAPVGLAVFRGVREAVQNVAVHAGSPTAALYADHSDGGLRVELTDSGRGFLGAEVGLHRRGISESIVGRMAAVGGRADVASAPGRGTRVTWTWCG